MNISVLHMKSTIDSFHVISDLNMNDKANASNMYGRYTLLTPVSSWSSPGMPTIQVDPNLTAPLGKPLQVTNPGGVPNLLYWNIWLWFRLETQGDRCATAMSAEAHPLRCPFGL